MPIPVVERSERDVANKIRRRVRTLEGVAECNEVTMGFTRKKPNIHFHVLLKGNPSFEQTHPLCSMIDREVRNLVPNARVVIHSEPSSTNDTTDVWKVVKRTAEGEPGSRGVQNIHLRDLSGKLGVDFNIQVSTAVSGDMANEFQERVIQNLKAASSRISEVIIHQQSVSYLVLSEQWGHGTEMMAYLEHISKRFPEITWVGPPVVWRKSDGLHLADRVRFAKDTSSERVTQIRSEFESAIKNGYPAIIRAEIVQDQGTIGEM
jgi:Dimerisation domain of Zinc Transporter